MTDIRERILNTEQRKAVEFGNGPLLIIAGAGTGKTTVVTERITHLITSGLTRPDAILALTFTEKASREMEERVDKALPYGATQMWISTFHAFCDRVLRNEAISIGLDPGFVLMAEAETILFIRRHLFEYSLEYFRPLGNPTKFLSGLITHFSRLKDEDITPTQYMEWAQSQVAASKSQTEEERMEAKKYLELAGAFKKYEELKVKDGVADYGDLISNTLRLFRTRKDVLKRYQDQFQYILIDEFQDTNYAQNELAILLAGERKNITVVGDDDQAIYRWRGAAISNILQFRGHFPKATAIVLTKNYRSTKEILDSSYTLIQNNNPDRLEVAENIDKKLESMRRVKGKPIEILYADRVENEAESVAKKILTLIETKDAPYTYSDVAILVRANIHAEPFARALSRLGIPYQFLGPGRLFRQPEVKDLIAYLKVLYNFEDSVAMYRILAMDYLGLHPRDLAAISNYAKKYGVSLFEACEVTSGLRAPEGVSVPKPFITSDSEQKLHALVAMVHRHLGLVKKESAGQILYFFLQDTGLLQQLTLFKTAREEQIALNITKFFNKLKTFEVEHDDASVFVVVDWIDLSMNLGESPLASDTDWTSNNAVSILTIHSAKGLEFPVVFLVNLVSQRFPTIARKEQIPLPERMIKEILPSGDYHLQEERRLFYVAMTRARDLLFFTAAQYYGEGKREKKLSPFIVEAVGASAVQRQIATGQSYTKQLPLIDWEKVIEKERDPTRQSISYLSYSQLDTFLTCPLQYKYRYILRIPVPPAAALSFGDTMHRTIKAFYEQVKAGDRPGENELLTLFNTLWSSLGYRDRAYEAKMKQHGEELLKGFFARGYDPERIPEKLEESFKIKITPHLTLGGKIDRVDRLPDGAIEIIDYKTGHAPKNRDVREDKQLSVYALAATNNGIYSADPEKVIVSFYFFEGQEKISAKRTQEQLDQTRAHIAKTAEEISGSDFKPTPGKHCDFCEFRLICEAWQ